MNWFRGEGLTGFKSKKECGFALVALLAQAEEG